MALATEDYRTIDCLTKFIQVTLTLKKAEERPDLLYGILLGIKSVIFRKYKESSHTFNQRPFFRIYVNLISDIAQPSDVLLQHSSSM